MFTQAIDHPNEEENIIHDLSESVANKRCSRSNTT